MDIQPRLIVSAQSWIEGDALRQLEKTTGLDGIEAAVGLPDLHPGKGSPVGAAFLSRKILYPFIIGNDVGCGIALFKTTLKRQKAKRDKWTKKLKNLEEPWSGDTRDWLRENGVEAPEYETACGTIGSGNHFAELQMVETIFDPVSMAAINVDKNELLLLIHSGSRGMGDDLLRRHTERFGAGGLPEDSQEAQDYLKQHDLAVPWAKANRALIAKRFAAQLNGECELILDACHNSITAREVNGDSFWLHRKGAAPSDGGPIVVPGSRGALSYLVKPQGEQQDNLWSLAHGAGRKWNRKSTRERMKSKYPVSALIQTKLGSAVICENRDLLFEEAPEAYKNVDTVIEDMLKLGLIKVLATLRPLITYKMRKEK